MPRKNTMLTFAVVFLMTATAKSQLTITPGSTFTIQSAGIVTVQGDITGNADILGAGKVVLKGSTNQNVNMNGFTIPNLEMDNAANATLTGNTRIGSSILFTNGKISAGNFNLNLADVATATGMGASKFVETNGTGQVIKELTANVTATEIPLGAGAIYRPAFITTSGTYSNANVGVKVLGATNPNRPRSLSDYISAYWPVTKTGVTGTVTLAGQYDNADISGTEANLRGYYYVPTDWSSNGSTNDAATNRVSAPITGATGELYAMDKFNLVKMKAFLQGAGYNTVTGLMNEGLRAPTLYIPAGEPYRSAPYTTSFTHVNNTIIETIEAASVFTTQTPIDNSIVDWVFLQLRDNTTPSTILQTRSALLQRDGDIVDVDGVSPVTFNNVLTGNYVVSVRHRNHLGLSTDPSGITYSFGETKSTATLVNMSTAPDNQLFGPSTAYTIANGINFLWGGNASASPLTSISNYVGSGNDKDYILNTGLSGNSTATVLGYNKSDINMNGRVLYVGSGNDKDYLLNTVLGGTNTTTRTQTLP